MSATPVALVCLPWLEPWHAPIGLAVVASQLRRHGMGCWVRFANLDLYSAIADSMGDEVAARLFGNGRLAELLVSPLWRRFSRSENEQRIRLLRPLGLDPSEMRKIQQLADECFERILAEPGWAQTRACGFSLGINQSLMGLTLARRLRESHPHVRIAFGGSQCSDPMGIALLEAFNFIDAVGCGECDDSIAPLFESLLAVREPTSIPNIAYRWEGHVRVGAKASTHAADFGTPDYDDFREPAMRFMRKHRKPVSYYVEGSRGCWWGEKHHCTFCGIHSQEIRSRSRPGADVVKDIVGLASSHPAINIALSDTLVPQAHLRHVVPALRTALSESDVELFADFKPNLSKRDVASLARSGFTGVQLGIETFSDRLLKRMRKGATSLQNVQALKWFTEAGVGVFYSLLVDIPGEEAEDYREVHRIMKAIPHLQPPSAVFPIEFDRYSPYFDRPSEFGIGRLQPHRIYRLVYGEGIDLHRFAYVYERCEPEAPAAAIADARASVLQCVSDWSTSYQQASLTYWVTGGTVLIVRAGDRPHVEVIEGLAAQLFLACDSIRRRSRLVDEFGQRGLSDTQEWIDRFIGEGFMLASANGEYLLALPLRRARLRPSKDANDEDTSSNIH
ncbi:MAG: RiPP maturation radical SAM C-methyltransferase [Reyranellaceae bacterium]